MSAWGGDVLAGKRALIIGGGGSGVGRAVAAAFVAEGGDVALIDIDQQSVDAAVALIARPGRRVIGMAADVRDAVQVARVVHNSASRLESIDVLVTVVGGQTSFGVPAAPLHDLSAAQVQQILDVNIGYVFNVLREAIPVMLRQPQGGTIVAVGSISGIAGTPTRAPYGAAKAALSNLCQTVAAEYGYAGIRMNVIAPGGIETPRTPRSADDAAAVERRIPLSRLAQPSDVADAAVFFACDLSRYITGQTIAVDGGVSASLFQPPRPTDVTPSRSPRDGQNQVDA